MNKSLKSQAKTVICIISAIFFGAYIVAGQQYPPGYIQQPRPDPDNLANPATYKQEIARLEIKVVRGDKSLPITQVPRVQKGDVIKVRLLDELVNGVKIDQTDWDWTLVVAFVNPVINKNTQESASSEIRFKKTGWYKEYSLTAPYDSQPIFFLSPRAQYRNQILKVINKKYNEVQKLGEKTIEIAGAYAQISTFLNEVQAVMNSNSYQYGGGQYGSNYGNIYGNTGYYPQYGNQGYPYQGSSYNYPGYGNYSNPHWMSQMVERLAKSFNIQLPDCWRSQSSQYSYGNFNSQDFVLRTQCVAKSIRVEDLDISITRMWQQGGVFLVSELQKKYPQIAYWINVAAVAIDFIVKAFRKSSLRLVPTLISTSDNPIQNVAYQPYYNSYQGANYTNNYQPALQAPPPVLAGQPGQNPSVKISVFAGVQPNDAGFVTAYPIVISKWQSDADPDVINLSPPKLLEPCLHVGQNILLNTDLSDEWVSDTFTRNFKLVVNSPNGFRKEFPLRKNVGLGGWELNVTPQDMSVIPKINMSLESTVVGTRGFNEISSQPFNLPISVASKWDVTAESAQTFSVGGRRRIVLRNALGDCRCLQSVTYKPSFGGQFTFEQGKDQNGLLYSLDGREAWFEVDTTQFQSGQGTLELRQYGGETFNINLKLYPPPPSIAKLNIARGDKQISVTGERLEQVQYIEVNGYRATLQPGSTPVEGTENQNLKTRIAVFDDSKVRQSSAYVTIQLGLEDSRVYPYPQTFPVMPARPAIAADNYEIEGISDAQFAPGAGQALTKLASYSNASSSLPAFPVSTTIITATLKNVLTDYDFKNESISIETRIEKSQASGSENIRPDFEVLDWKTMRIKFFLSGDIGKNLGGRRIQFRIRDKERGDSDWYTIKQTFVRLPVLNSLRCTNEMQGMCEMRGLGMDYIQQVSTDGGVTWFPEQPEVMVARPVNDGSLSVMIPYLRDRKNLRIRLRDFPGWSGMTPGGYSYSNLVTKPFARQTAISKPADTDQGASGQNTYVIQNEAIKGANPKQNSDEKIKVTNPRQSGTIQNPPQGQPTSVDSMDEVIDMGKPR